MVDKKAGSIKWDRPFLLSGMGFSFVVNAVATSKQADKTWSGSGLGLFEQVVFVLPENRE
ncbi:MAG TPA: hypothetical protein VK152_06275 [Paludibacter sp.]|nr:hypothetical protein [Paludibacter sp.]